MTRGMRTGTDVSLPGGRTLRVYDTGGEGGPAIFWHHGTPNTGAPPEPLFDAAARHGVRWVSYDRPGYGGSSPEPGRAMASAAGCTAAVADALGIGRFAVLGHSSGGPHALACAALLPDRVLAVASVSGLAPFGADGLNWFGGMAAAGEASLRAALAGREAKERYEASAEFDPETFTPADHAALSGPWSWFGEIVASAVATDRGGMVDDELANVAPWGFDPAGITAPVLVLHGEDDRVVPVSHAAWVAGRCPSAELRTHPGEGHISVLRHGAAALDWLAGRA